MMGIGIDIIELDRMSDIVARSGDIFLQRVFSSGELQRGKRCQNPTAFFASAFAAKEAVFKALVLNWEQGVDLRDIEVSRGEYGEPLIHLHGVTKAWAEGKGCPQVLISLSYERNLAIAVAITARA